MAKIKFGMMMTDARGKLGGQVFSKNRAGSYIRTKVTPVNPRTVAQMESRSILGSLSTGWGGLTEAQRATWNNAVESWQKTDIFGDLKKPTGKNLYVALNKNLLQSGQSEILTAPEKIDIPIMESPGAVIGITSEEILYNSPAFDGVWQVSVTPQLPQGVSFVKNKLRVVGYAAGGMAPTGALYSEMVAKFGTPEVGDNIYVQFRAIGENGQAGVPVIVKAPVQAV